MPTRKFLLSLLAISIFFTLCPYLWGQELKIQAARILKTKGTVMIYQSQSKKWSVAKKGIRLFEKDMIKTLSESEVDLLIGNIAVVRLKENTVLKLAEIERELTKSVTSSRILLVEGKPLKIREKSILKLLKGKLLLWVKYILKGSTFEVSTPIGIAGVRGTLFMVYVPNQDTTIVAVLEGIVEAKNIQMPEKTVLIRKMESSIIVRGAYPSEPRRVSEKEYKDLKETLELKLFRGRRGFKRKPGSRYNGIYSSNYIYWEGSRYRSEGVEAQSMTNYGSMSTGSVPSGSTHNTMVGHSTITSGTSGSVSTHDISNITNRSELGASSMSSNPMIGRESNVVTTGENPRIHGDSRLGGGKRGRGGRR